MVLSKLERTLKKIDYSQSDLIEGIKLIHKGFNEIPEKAKYFKIKDSNVEAMQIAYIQTAITILLKVSFPKVVKVNLLSKVKEMIMKE